MGGGTTTTLTNVVPSAKVDDPHTTKDGTVTVTATVARSPGTKSAPLSIRGAGIAYSQEYRFVRSFLSLVFNYIAQLNGTIKAVENGRVNLTSQYRPNGTTDFNRVA